MDGELTITERSFDSDAEPIGEVSERFRLEPAAGEARSVTR
jgi:hypothetical protein